MNNSAVRIGIVIRLGGKVAKTTPVVAVKKSVRTGITVFHAKKAWRFPGHGAINKIISNALSKIDFPNQLEPPGLGLSRSDGKSVDSFAIIPWELGKYFLCPVFISISLHEVFFPSKFSQLSNMP